VFCQHDHWDEKKTDHYRYAKVLPDGRHLRTKISFGAGQVNDAGLFAAILRVELQVSETEFWRVVENHGPAQHTPLPQAIAPAQRELTLETVMKLRKVGATMEQVKRLDSQAEAEELLRRLTGAK